MIRHKFNIFPEASAEDFERLVADIQANGFDATMPVTLYEGAILDGWNRQRACDKLGVKPAYTTFSGSRMEAFNFTVRTNNRRNMTSSQWAAVAVDGGPILEEIAAEVEAQRRVKQAAAQSAQAATQRAIEQADADRAANQHALVDAPPVSGAVMARLLEVTKQAAEVALSGNKFPDSPKPDDSYTATKVAAAFNTNATYIKDAKRLKAENPEVFAQIKNGEKTITEVKKVEKQIKREAAIAEQTATAKTRPTVEVCDAMEWLEKQPMCDLLITDPPYSTDVEDIEAFAKSWLPLALSKVKPTGRAFVFIGAYPKELQAYLNTCLPEQVLVWTYRNTLGPTPATNYKLNWQAILYFKGVDAAPLDCPVMLEQFSVQDISAPDGRQGDRYHAWQKPVDIADRFIRHTTKQGDLILDPFACTGTFLVAAAALNREASGCDISAKNLKIAEGRGCLLKTI